MAQQQSGIRAGTLRCLGTVASSAPSGLGWNAGSRTQFLACSEKGVRLAQKIQVGPCIPVGVQLDKAAVGPTSGSTWRIFRLRVSRAAQAIPSRWSTIRCDKHKHEFDVQNVTWTSLGTRPSWGQAQRLGSPRIPTASTCACFESPPESHELRLGVLRK